MVTDFIRGSPETNTTIVIDNLGVSGYYEDSFYNIIILQILVVIYSILIELLLIIIFKGKVMYQNNNIINSLTLGVSVI